MIRLLTNYYQDSSKIRQAELDRCIEDNRNNFREAGGIVHIVQDDISGRPTYEDMFNLANTMSFDDDITVIANTDIIFPVESIEKIKSCMRREICIALTRWDTPLSVPKKYNDGKSGWKIRLNKYSQDCWIFFGKIKVPKTCNFFMGIPGCDNRIAYELYDAGYKMVNPCKSIVTFHHHESAKRNGAKSMVSPPYMLINHITIEEIGNEQTPHNVRDFVMEV